MSSSSLFAVFSPEKTKDKRCDTPDSEDRPRKRARDDDEDSQSSNSSSNDLETGSPVDDNDDDSHDDNDNYDDDELDDNDASDSDLPAHSVRHIMYPVTRTYGMDVLQTLTNDRALVDAVRFRLRREPLNPSYYERHHDTLSHDLAALNQQRQREIREAEEHAAGLERETKKLQPTCEGLQARKDALLHELEGLPEPPDETVVNVRKFRAAPQGALMQFLRDAMKE